MQTRHRRAHRRIWLALAVLLPLALLYAATQRPTDARDAPPLRLAPPQ